MNDLIEAGQPKHVLGISIMDDIHSGFIQLVNALGRADKIDFAELFEQLVQHTEEHFLSEKNLMLEHKFPALQEHLEEHNRVSGELSQIALRVRDGSFLIARSYIQNRIPEWFDLHASTMDSALAAHLKISLATEG